MGSTRPTGAAAVTRFRWASTQCAFLVAWVAIAMLLPCLGNAQSAPSERTFKQSKATVDKTLKSLQPSASGRLPVLDGFTVPGDRSLDRFQRGFYQCTIQTSSAPSGGTLVRVSAKITAWYADSDPSKSGYQSLPSNGRLEGDFLDRLQDALSGQASSPPANTGTISTSPQSKNASAATTPSISAATPNKGASAGSMANSKLPEAPTPAPSKLGSGAGSDLTASLATQKAVADKHMEELTKEAKGLEEILRTQAHPKNLVAVKKSGTPVLESPAEGAKVLFLATAQDEFEILDMNVSWVHVRISGLSRGWIRRSGLEVPEIFSPDEKAEDAPGSANTEPFQVKNEEIASFPGTWEPLQGKTVKILTVQKVSASGTGPKAKLEFTKSLFEKEYAEFKKAPSGAAGVVVIFDSEDGGMAAATLPSIQQWKAGTISDQAFWRRCFFDPPETFMPQTSP
jgi:hypothetical protein